MMNTMMFANMDEYLDKSSSEVIISKITRGNYFLRSNIDLLKKEIDGYLKLSKHFTKQSLLWCILKLHQDGNLNEAATWDPNRTW